MLRRTYKDYYKILGVQENAANAEIKKAFRKLALENHPDHHPGDPTREDKFKEITEAYGVLIDPGKRREYDQFRALWQSGRRPGADQFNYSQQEIFENMFREGFARDMFEELNREFSKSGYRSGNTFFQTVFFGGAIGGLSRILGMIPGPLGKIGHGLRLAHMVGSSILAYKRMRQAQNKGKPDQQEDAKIHSNVMDSIKEAFKKSQNPGPVMNPLDIHFSITLPPAEAMNGTRKKISYKAGDKMEQLSVRIPANFADKGKLRIREKGRTKNGTRGDLILTIHVES